MADPRRRASGDLSNSPVCLSVYGALLLHVSAGALGHFVSATSPLPTPFDDRAVYQLLLRPRQQRCGVYCDESVGMSLCRPTVCACPYLDEHILYLWNQSGLNFAKFSVHVWPWLSRCLAVLR